MADQPGTYANSGVNYDLMDQFKRACQQAGLQTAGNLQQFADGAFTELKSSRGESVYLIETPDSYLAHVEEGLGTKNLVADAMYTLTGKSYYNHLAQDTVAMIVNDLITLGALPLSVAMHLAVGHSDWFKDKQRWADLIQGWQTACTLARCTWGGGETPTLKDVILPHAAVLAGSAIGIVRPKANRIQGDIQPGDAIIMLASSGIHANGLTLARQIAERTGYDAPLSDGRPFGDALLDPTVIYVPVLADCQQAGIRPHYAVNITGHGWRKLMRTVEPFVYIIEHLPTPQPVFTFIQHRGHISEREMYAIYNMGAGFALYVDPADTNQVIDLSRQNGITAWVAGHIEKRDHQKKVIITPKHLEYDGASLAVR